MSKRGRELDVCPPLWEYRDGRLHGPSPIPPVPPVTEIHGGEFGAGPDHDVAEVDQELCTVSLGRGFVPHPWHEDREEHSFRLRDWKGIGWYSRYRRKPGSRRFSLTHVWADTWVVATSDGKPAIAARRPRADDGNSIGASSSSSCDALRNLPGF